MRGGSGGGGGGGGAADTEPFSENAETDADSDCDGDNGGDGDGKAVGETEEDILASVVLTSDLSIHVFCPYSLPHCTVVRACTMSSFLSCCGH